MKLSATILALAALAVSSLMGGAEAGTLDGPCTITADMSSLTGSCPTGFQKCIASMDLSPDPDSSTPQVALNSDCWQPGLNQIRTIQNSQAAIVSATIRNGYAVAAGGSNSDDTVIGLVRLSDDSTLCQADASVTSGTCLNSDRAPSSGGGGGGGGGGTSSSAAASAHAGVVATAAAVVAGAAALLL